LTYYPNTNSRRKFYWPFSVDKILHANKHLNIDEQIFWFICDRTVWHRRFIRQRSKDTGDWWTLCSGRVVAEELNISQQYARKRLSFLRKIGLLKASGHTNRRQYTTVFYDEIRTSYLQDRRWTRQPKPIPDQPGDTNIATPDEIAEISRSTKQLLQKKIHDREEYLRSIRPVSDESAFHDIL